jgi:hypothetical protein
MEAGKWTCNANGSHPLELCHHNLHALPLCPYLLSISLDAMRKVFCFAFTNDSNLLSPIKVIFSIKYDCFHREK